MAPSKSKEVREFIPVGINDSSDDELETMLGVDKKKGKSIGLDEEYSDDGEGLYSEDDDEEDVEEEEEHDDDVEDEGGEDEGDDEDELSEGEFDDGDEADLAQEGEEDSEDDDDEISESVSYEPEPKKAKGLGELARKLAALEEEIADIESKQIDKKHWTLTGEVTGKSRPINSLLEANLELPFGHMATKRLDETKDLMVDENDFDPENPEKPVFDIELIVKQRVADRTFDDVVKRKVETVVHDQKPSDSTQGLDFEKSQLGLAEVYAKQYEKDVFNQSEDAEKLSAEKEEAKGVFAKLMHKLDCLTNFNFAPRPPVVKKSSGLSKDIPAMKLEEPIPLVISASVRANHN